MMFGIIYESRCYVKIILFELIVIVFRVQLKYYLSLKLPISDATKKQQKYYHTMG